MERSREELIEVIRKACQKACPELLELSFGCEVRFKGRKFDKIVCLGKSEDRFVWWKDKDDPERSNFCVYEEYGWSEGEILEIIGHEPQLQHVLAAIDKSQNGKTDILITANGIFGSMDKGSLGKMWNLSHGLYGQSDETLQFIASLLVKE